MGKHYLKTLLACSLLSYTSINYADDSEIFFGQDTSTAKPNIIFLLDRSASMRTVDINGQSRVNALKDALEQILTDPDTKDLQMGAMLFYDRIELLQPVININEINDYFDMMKTPDGDFTNIQQKVLWPFENGVMLYNSSNAMSLDYESHWLSPINPDGTTGASLFGSYRFDNILVKNLDPNKETDIANATFKIPRHWAQQGNVDTLDVFIDDTVNAPILRDKYNFFKDTFDSLNNQVAKTCTAAIGAENFECNVTDLIRAKISHSNWQAGNAITFHVRFNSTTNSANMISISGRSTYSTYEPLLVIKAKNYLIADNKKTNRDFLLSKMLDMGMPEGYTDIVQGMYHVGSYVSNKTKTTNEGPYHDPIFNDQWKSPLLEGCQSTHMVLMSDGDPTNDYQGVVAPYIGTGSQCFLSDGTKDFDNVNEYGHIVPPQNCARALAEWMATTNQSTFEGGNFIRTHTIAFAMGENAFLKDIAHYGQGNYYATNNASELAKALKEIIIDALVVDALSTSGTVSLSPQTQYEQRLEVFYSLFKSDNYNYWSGNMKGFKLKYIDTTLADGSPAQRPILVDKNGNPAISTINGGIFPSASSLWSENDGGTVEKGGVLGQLTPDGRKDQMHINDIEGPLLSKATKVDLGVQNDDIKTGLLQFIQGYKYVEGGHKLEGMSDKEKESITELKIGDSARSAITLATYGCNDTTKDILNCLQGDLQQVALLASNDGFLRGYDTAKGKTLYEIMPEKMLANIKKLQEAAPISYKEPRFYGLDGTVTVYHDDKNKDGYINTDETAMAFVIAGRGGKHLYAYDITNMNSPILKWTFQDNIGSENIGYTWSVPVIGNIKDTDGTVTPVLIFGGGYDTSQDNNPYRHKSGGDGIYVVNATNGKIIWSKLNLGYSIPSSVAVLRDEESDEKFITDIFVGDMGGQLWRFKVNQLNSTEIIEPVGRNGGVIAELAGDGLANSRRFYHAPVVYEFPKSSTLAGQIAVSIGSGYRAHPLSTDTNDRIYSLRVPKDTSTVNKVIKPEDLVVTNLKDNTIDEKKLQDSDGFVVELGVLNNAEGEKVISEAKADFGRIVFNTYIPTKTTTLNCKPSNGTQRTYVIDLETGLSLLGTAYDETGISALPADIALYCNGKFCTFISGSDALSEKDINPAYTVPVPGEGIYSKISTTDLFNL